MLNLNIGRWKKLLVTTTVLVLVVAICQYLQYFDSSKHYPLRTSPSNEESLLIWWTPLMDGSYESSRMCDLNFCRFTTKRDQLDTAKAILFYGSNIKTDDFPLPRQFDHVWALIHEESPRNVPFMPYADWLQHFNFTSTFSRNSNLPLTTYYLTDIDNLTSPAYVTPIGEKSRHKDQALVLFIQSDCDTMSGRDDYVKELMNYIKVDSFGACLKNSELPESLQKIQHDYLNNLYSPELLKFIARYKFVISYENGVCVDYITEKFWRPLIAGSIPIYYGSPSIKDWAPNKYSFIDVNDFKSPESLAIYLKKLAANDKAYNSYLNHKYNMVEPIANKKLMNELHSRKAAMYSGELFQSFECAVCSFLMAEGRRSNQIATAKDYDCPHEPVYPSMYTKMANYDDWHSIMLVGKCKAQILDRLFKRNKNFTDSEFMKILKKDMATGKC